MASKTRKPQKKNQDTHLELLDKIKRLTVFAMFSDDELLEQLVLKGGNAMDLVHHASSRASVDIDFSMPDDLPGGLKRFRERIEKTLKKTFRANGYEPFDIKMEEKPEFLSADIASFWGGYSVAFKLIDSETFEEIQDDLDALRRNAVHIGQGQKFLIDISRHEYTEDKQRQDFDGLVIFVYSPEMIVCEKLRAICQQMPQYGEIVHRGRPGAPRARDFFDISVLVETLNLEIASEKNMRLLTAIFEVKKVPLSFLGEIGSFREFHRTNFSAVVDSLKSGVKHETFDYYFDSVLALVDRLKPLWDV